MTKKASTVEAQPDKKNGHKPRLAPVAKPVKESAGIADRTAEIPLGSSYANSGANLAVEVARLGDLRLPTIQRQTVAMQIGQMQGNDHLQRLTIQLQRNRRPRGANPGGRGPGRIQHAVEHPYDVRGATLDALADQLGRFDGFAAETSAPLGMRGRVRPQRLPDGTFQARVQWVINEASVGLPRWANYDDACPAAQAEWDRYMTRTRQHEQEAHVNAARDFAAQLGDEDTVITGATIAEVQTNLEAKQQELGARLQAIHDSCDHGVSIDAVLHPDNGQCQ